MRTQPLRRLGVEQLEDRWVPATVKLVSGTLLVSDPRIVNGAASLTLTRNAAGQFTVVDGNSTIGTYRVNGNVLVRGSNANDNLTVDLNGNNYGGNLLLLSGNANDTITLKSAAATPATIGGNLTIRAGNGNETVELAQNADISVGGAVLVDLAGGDDSLTSTNKLTVGSDMTLLGVNHYEHAGDLIVGRNYTQSVVGDEVVSDYMLNAGGLTTVGGNFTWLGNSFSDEVRLTSGGSIDGSVVIELGVNQDTNFVQQLRLTGNPIAIGGDVFVRGGANANPVQNNRFLAGVNTSIAGNTIIDFRGAQTARTEFVGNYGGSVTYLSDNGPLAGNAILATGTIAGDLNVQFGNGNHNVLVSTPPAGRLNWTSGNGANALTLDGAGTYQLAARFGNGDDTVTLNNAAAVLSGNIDGGGRLLVNSFTQTAGTLAPLFQLSNFP